jgi:hypothetical protein
MADTFTIDPAHTAVSGKCVSTSSRTAIARMRCESATEGAAHCDTSR